MTCRRAFDIDLPAFLAEPRAAAWDDFRDHYPRCRDCAAEVAAWTELHHALLDGAHPDEETLLRFADQPETLDAARRDEVERHVARCASCTDELRALARFAAPAGAPAPAGRTSVSRPAAGHRIAGARTRPSALRRVGRVLWHPALPYAALLALVLLPAFRERFGWWLGEQPAPMERAEPAPGTGTLRARQQRVARTGPAALERVAPAAGPPAEQEVAPGAQAKARAATDEERHTASSGAPPPAAPQALSAGLADTVASATRPGGGGGAVELTGEPTSPVRVLVVRLPGTPSRGATYAVRIAAAGGGREIRQVVTVSPASGRVALELPGAWLEPGRYEVEVAPPGEAPVVRETLTVPSG